MEDKVKHSVPIAGAFVWTLAKGSTAFVDGNSMMPLLTQGAKVVRLADYHRALDRIAQLEDQLN